MIDLKAMDLKDVTPADALAEVEREMRLRAGVYPKWMEAGKLKDEDAAKQYAGMKKAHQIVKWAAGLNMEDYRLGAALVKLMKEDVGRFADAIGDANVAALAKAFPGAKLRSITEKTKEAA